MAIGEGAAATLRYKKYTSATMAETSIATRSSDPGTSGGQLLRRVGAEINPVPNFTRSAEVNPSRMTRSARLTASVVQGSITGELSPGTYFPFMEAVLRGTAASGVVAAPTTGHVSRKWLFERYNSDLDISRVYEECRINGFRVQQSADSNATIEVMLTGRRMVSLTSTNAPFFASPTAAGTKEVCNSAAGTFTIDGVAVGLITGITLNAELEVEAPRVLGQTFPSGVLLGGLNVSGQLTFLLNGTDTAMAAFLAETEAAIVATLNNATTGGDSVSFRMPRVKYTRATEQVRGGLSQPISVDFEALEYLGTASGVPNTVLQITDTAG